MTSKGKFQFKFSTQAKTMCDNQTTNLLSIQTKNFALEPVSQTNLILRKLNALLQGA